MANELHLSTMSNATVTTLRRIMQQRVLTAIITAMLALGLMVAESWAIERAPAFIAACDLAQISDRGGTLGTLLGLGSSPIAVLH